MRRIKITGNIFLDENDACRCEELNVCARACIESLQIHAIGRCLGVKDKNQNHYLKLKIFLSASYIFDIIPLFYSIVVQYMYINASANYYTQANAIFILLITSSFCISYMLKSDIYKWNSILYMKLNVETWQIGITQINLTHFFAIF